MLSKNLRRTIIIGPLILVGLLFLFPVIKPLFYSKERREALRQYREQREAVLEEWGGASYRAIEVGGAFDASVVESVRSETEAELPGARQQEQLGESVVQFIHAHSSLSWDRYRAYRLPLSEKNTRFESRMLSHYRFALPSPEEFDAGVAAMKRDPASNRDISEGGPFFRTDTDWNIFRTYWELAVKLGSYPDSNKAAYCCWQSIAVEDIQVNVSEILEGPNPRGLSVQMATNAVPASFTLASSVRYRPSLEDLLTKGKRVTAATVSLLVRDNHQSTPYPIHVGFYWHTSHQRWLPFALEAVGQRRSVMKYFF